MGRVALALLASIAGLALVLLACRYAASLGDVPEPSVAWDQDNSDPWAYEDMAPLPNVGTSIPIFDGGQI